MMRTQKRRNRVFFALFAGVWGVLIAANLLTPEKDFSETENRSFSDSPAFSVSALLNGDWMRRIDTYLDEQFLGRDTWIAAQSFCEYALGKREINGVWIGDNMLFSRLAEPKPNAVRNNIMGITAFAQQQKGPVRVMLVPSASAVCTSLLPPLATATWEQDAATAEIYSELSSIAQPIALQDALRTHADKGESIYYRTDHHWTTWGAWLGYEQYCAAAGLTPAPYQAETVSTQFDGTLYSKSGVRFVDSDAMEAFTTARSIGCDVYDGQAKAWQHYDSPYFTEYLSKQGKYSYFLGPLQPVVRLYGNANTGKKLLLFKDSYAHCLAPMLLEHYDEVALVDLRLLQSDLNDLLRLSDYDETLILYSLDTFTSSGDLQQLQQLHVSNAQ